MKNIFNKILKNKKTIFSMFLLVGLGVFGVANISMADFSFTDTIGNTIKATALSPVLVPLSAIFFIIMAIVGSIDTLMIGAIQRIAVYNNFIGQQTISDSWVIVRDLGNMFFILILLTIAFATILRLENYSAKKMLPKLLIMAVLINFSKTIFGLFIDFSQVIMLTFVNAWGTNGAGFVEITQMSKYFSSQFKGFFGGTSGYEWSALNTLVGIAIGIMFMIISGIVLVVALAVFVMRIIMIWIYIVLSPLVFLGFAFPPIQQYTGKIWEDFIKQLIVGPVLAFFIWMAMMASKSINSLGDFKNQAEGLQCTGITDITCLESFLPFIISLGMLIGGLMVAQQAGGAAGSIAGQGLSFAKKIATKGAKDYLTGDNFFARKFTKTAGVDWRPVKLWESYQASRETSKREDETQIRQKAREHFEASGGMLSGARSVLFGTGVGEDYFNRYTDGFLALNGLKRAARDVFINPMKRRQIGAEINKKEENIKKDEQEQNDLESKKKEFLEQNKNNYSLSLKNDLRIKETELLDLEREMTPIRKKSKKDLTKEDEEKLEKYTLKKDNLEKELDNIKLKIKESLDKQFLGTNEGKRLIELEGKLKIDKDELKQLTNKIIEVQAPMAFEARSLYRRDVEEAKSKYKSITNAEELMKALTDAIQREDKFDQVAILEKLSSDGNLNEELKKKGYASNSKGLCDYVNNEKNVHGENVGLSGFSSKDKIQILNDLGESEEQVKHWEMAKMVGMNNKGELESLVKKIGEKDGRVIYDDTRHAQAAFAEILKLDPQKVINSLNRLAMGGEDGNGDFQISNLGKMIYKYLASGGYYERNSGRILGNTAANLMSPNVVPILEQLMQDNKKRGAETIKIMRERGTSDNTSFKPGSFSEWIKKAGLWD